MKILHTSDWHLGRMLYGRKRYAEFAAFLAWLLQTISDEQVDVLLVAGDIFDSTTPSHHAQALYYQFLAHVSRSSCRHVVIIAGNHDSPSLLNAPQSLLHALNVHVIGATTDNIANEVIVLRKNNLSENALGNVPEAIVCAVPYLRDKDIRRFEAGESIDAKNAKLVAGLKQHYAQVAELAEQQRQQFITAGHGDIPIIGMGHLFATGGKTVDGDGVRELYVGTLARVNSDAFPRAFDYLALGHLHVTQTVGNTEHIRYSGSPIAMGFAESNQQKKVLIIEFTQRTPHIREWPVPCFQTLIRLTGTLEHILEQLETLKSQNSSAWLEIEYTGRDLVGNLRESVDTALQGSSMEVRRLKNHRLRQAVTHQQTAGESLDELDINEVFSRCLTAASLVDAERQELINTYREIVQSIHESDSHAQ